MCENGGNHVERCEGVVEKRNERDEAGIVHVGARAAPPLRPRFCIAASEVPQAGMRPLSGSSSLSPSWCALLPSIGDAGRPCARFSSQRR